MQVFVSHRTDADATIANRLAADLDAVGIAAWIAPRDVDPGTTWPRAIERGLQTSTHAAVLVSETTLASRAVQLELQMAEMLQVEGRLELIPVLLGDVELPPWLAIMQWVDLRRSYQDGFASLTAALRSERQGSARPATDVEPLQTGGRTYRIGGRGRLDVIAAELLGSPHDWRRLLERHPEIDPLRLPCGTQLIVPAGDEIGGAGG